MQALIASEFVAVCKHLADIEEARLEAYDRAVARLFDRRFWTPDKPSVSRSDVGGYCAAGRYRAI